jgi:very-short-patch-repair endonuclease
VKRWVANGRLVRLHRGVYAVGHAHLRGEGHWLAAVLACGEGAGLAYRSAAALWEFRGVPGGKVEVVVPRGRRGPTTVRVYRPRGLELTTHRGIPVTTPLRTLRDLKRILSLDALESAAARAATRGLITDDEAAAVVGRRPQLTRTQQERLFRKAARAAGLPEPEMNAWVTHGGGEEWQADALFRRKRLIVELDGGSHRTPKAFEDDRHKDAVRQADGFRALRFTDRQLLDTGSLTRLLRRVAYAAR